jgi:alpha-glucoside transport system permease protein
MAVAETTMDKVETRQRTVTPRRRMKWGPVFVNIVLALICILWTIPTLGLLVSSFRTREDIINSGWWNVLPHPEWVNSGEISLEFAPGRPFGEQITERLSRPIEVNGNEISVTDEQLRTGYRLPNGQQIQWANRRSGTIAVQNLEWRADTDLSLNSYQRVVTGETVGPDGTVRRDEAADFGAAFLNSVVVAVPATVIPILIAAFAAYAFAWMKFPGRKLMFGLVVALLVIPLQIALSPILSDYQNLNLTGTYLAVWLAHTGFGLPLATYLLFNYVSQLPRDLFESAFIDGASPFTVFTRLVLPLSVPALASFAIFQFLWVWNDYLVALIFLGGQNEVITMRLVDLVGSRGQDWHLLTAGAFLSMLLPLTVFFSLQRFFVRGLLAGSVKG